MYNRVCVICFIFGYFFFWKGTSIATRQQNFMINAMISNFQSSTFLTYVAIYLHYLHMMFLCLSYFDMQGHALRIKGEASY